MKRYSIFILLIFITFIGLSLRITGLSWGLPTSKYFPAASYYPDESEVLKAYQGINPRKLNFRLTTDTVQIKGTFHPYLMAVWIKLASIFNIVEIYSSFDYYKNNPNELVKLYVTGRSLSVFFGIATILLIFFIGKGKIFYGNGKIGLLAAFFLAITPLHIIYSHYIVTDILLTFLTTVVLFLSYYILRETNTKIYIITGLLTGLTVATKYSIFPLVIIPILAHLLSKNKILDKRLLFYILFIPLGFFIGNPYSISEPQIFLASLKYSKQINITLDPSMNSLDCFGPQNNLFFYLTTAPNHSFGIPLSLLFLCGIIFAFIKREKIDILILTWIALFLLFISFSSPWKILRWQMPYIPLLCILSARFIDLEGFSDPVVEVYGLTHAGHGSLCIYEIQNDRLNLLFRTVAVDYNPDTRWAPDNFKKYGYETCGEIFAGGKLTSEYRDINKDGNLDLVLSGEQEIICESDDRSNGIHELKLASIPVKKIFLWDNDAHLWGEITY